MVHVAPEELGRMGDGVLYRCRAQGPLETGFIAHK